MITHGTKRFVLIGAAALLGGCAAVAEEAISTAVPILVAELFPEDRSLSNDSGRITLRVDDAANQVCADVTVRGTRGVHAVHVHRAGSDELVLTLPYRSGTNNCVTAKQELIDELLSRPEAFSVGVHTHDRSGRPLRGTLSRPAG